jgi:hypothetical protein
MTPVVGATVTLLGSRSRVTSDSAGRFEHAGLRVGAHVLQIHAPGFASASLMLDLAEAEVATPVVALDSAPASQLLPEVSVSAPRPMGRRYADFERRRATGRGSFLTSEDFEKRGASTLIDMLRTLRGVRTDCSGFQCQVRMARSVGGCEPQYWVDGTISNAFGPNTPVRDIRALEVYVGPAETPAEFTGANSSCGTIVIWTKSAP